METLGTLSEGDWCSLGSMFLYQEEDFAANFLAWPAMPYEDSSYALQPTLWPSHESAMGSGDRAYCSFDAAHHNSLWSAQVSMEECIAMGFLPNSSSSDSLEYLTTASASVHSEVQETDAGNSSCLIGTDGSPLRETMGGDESNEDMKDTQLPGGSCDSGEIAAAKSEKSTDSSDKSRKRLHGSEDGNARNVRRKNKKPHLPGKINEEGRRALDNDQGSTLLPEGDSSSPRELSGQLPNISSSEPAGLNHNCKTRAARGAATDPQSLYARKRRERINERLRILQKLVPNGTKVDISTMLEEAVHYVKFLQLQIRMLSSDESWMYAPISYNGMNIGLRLE